MNLEIVDVLSLSSGAENEDRGGGRGKLAWVIDGATDVIPAPLTGAHSDAAWIAAEIESLLRRDAAAELEPFSALPAQLARDLALAFEAAQRRVPQGRDEHPSAAGIVVRLNGAMLEYVSVGDCALLAQLGAHLHIHGVGGTESGDRWVREAIAADRGANPGVAQKKIRENLWPKLRAARGAMNMPHGYGVLSITPPPPEFIHSGALGIEPGALILLASDGLTRLVDVFGRYDAHGFFAAACARGLGALGQELRAAEREDADCISFPRAKISDDATGVLLRVAGG